MRKGKFQQMGRHIPATLDIKPLMLVLACILLLGNVGGVTIAWLTAQTTEVENVFTTGNISVELEESENLEFKMIPGWTITKDPKVTVENGSEDCYLFVKISSKNATISKNTDGSYSLGDYIVYAVDSGWTALEGQDNVFYMVIDDESEKNVAYSVLGSGRWTDPMGTVGNTTDDEEVEWTADQVATEPSVTKEMMESVTSGNQPTLSFTAYAVQLYKNNTDTFEVADAWAKISTTD